MEFSVSNKRSVIIQLIFRLVLILKIIISVIIFYDLLFLIASTFIILFIAISILYLRIVEYKINGGCISVKRGRPLNSIDFKKPFVEIPQGSLLYYKLAMVGRSNFLSLTFLSSQRRKRKVRIRLDRYTKQQLQTVSDSLMNITNSSRNSDELQ